MKAPSSSSLPRTPRARGCCSRGSRAASRSRAYLERHGRPIRYGYVKSPWPLDAYQNVYATTPGSAEMASAGRPFTPQLITRLVAGGVLFAPITLHCGVSSPERHEAPLPERFEVPEQTAALIRSVREWGGRVIAVGTTVVRALETVAQPDGCVVAGAGWTSLVVTPERGLWLVDGLITGWHEPEASHLEMLEAAAGPQLLARSYDAALGVRVPVARVRRQPPRVALSASAALNGVRSPSSATACGSEPSSSTTAPPGQYG